MNDNAIPADTTRDAERVKFAGLRRLSSAQRSEMTELLSQKQRLVALAEVRRRHPSYSERQVKLVVMRANFGDELFRKVFPNVDIDQ